MIENQQVMEWLSRGMRVAAAQGRGFMGASSPNPPVGAAALDQAGEIIAVAAHRRAGTDHAEAALLKLCRKNGTLGHIHTMCVTLEPCNHHGRTPPCSEAIIAAGIRRVAIGLRDPNPHVQGGGADRLRAAGIEVIENIEPDICARSMHAFLFQAAAGKPFVTVKRAFDAAGSMLPPAGQKTFTAAPSLTLAHRLRKKADAIVTGSGTVIADNPLFDVRHAPDHDGKRRMLAILDRRGRVSADYIAAAQQRGLDAEIFGDFDSCLLTLSKRGIQDILVEAGPILSRFALDSGNWAMKVDIHAGAQDRIEAACNPAEKMPFDANDLQLESLLPL